MSKRRARLICHHCGRPHDNRLGGDITCSPECRERFAKAQKAAAEKLTAAGFVQNAEIPNLWAKNGVHISIEQVIREGFEKTVAAHKKVRPKPGAAIR